MQWSVWAAASPPVVTLPAAYVMFGSCRDADVCTILCDINLRVWLQVVDKLKAHPGSNVRTMAIDVQSSRLLTGSFDKAIKIFGAGAQAA